jgi:hypothetical protein
MYTPLATFSPFLFFPSQPKSFFDVVWIDPLHSSLTNSPAELKIFTLQYPGAESCTLTNTGGISRPGWYTFLDMLNVFGVDVAVACGVKVGVSVSVKVSVSFGVKVAVEVLVSVGVLVMVRVLVGVTVWVSVRVFVGVKVWVGVRVTVRVWVTVGVFVMVRVKDGV